MSDDVADLVEQRAREHGIKPADIMGNHWRYAKARHAAIRDCFYGLGMGRRAVARALDVDHVTVERALR